MACRPSLSSCQTRLPSTETRLTVVPGVLRSVSEVDATGALAGGQLRRGDLGIPYFVPVAVYRYCWTHDTLLRPSQHRLHASLSEVAATGALAGGRLRRGDLRILYLVPVVAYRYCWTHDTLFGTSQHRLLLCFESGGSTFLTCLQHRLRYHAHAPPCSTDCSTWLAFRSTDCKYQRTGAGGKVQIFIIFLAHVYFCFSCSPACAY